MASSSSAVTDCAFLTTLSKYVDDLLIHKREIARIYKRPFGCTHSVLKGLRIHSRLRQVIRRFSGSQVLTDRFRDFGEVG